MRKMLISTKGREKETESESTRGKGGQIWKIKKSGVDMIEL